MNLIILISFLLLPSPLTLASGQKEVKRVLILYSQNEGHQAHDWTDMGLRATLKSNEAFDVEIYTEYLDLSRFRGEAYQAALANFIHKKYEGMKIDLILSVYKAAADFLIKHGGDLIKVPTVFVSIHKSDCQEIEKSAYGGNATGIFLIENIDHSVSTALTLVPDARRIVVISGVSETDKERKEIILSALKKYQDTFELIDVSSLPMDAMKAKMASLPSDTIAFYSTMFLDASGRSFVPKEAIQQLAAVSAVPIFGFYEGHLGHGIVGGRLVIYSLQGERAGRIGLRILKGEAPGSIPFDSGEDTYADLYDWRQIKRWGLSEALLPAGSVVRFRPTTIWQLYKWHIAGVAAFGVTETFLVIALFINLQKRKKAEQALRGNQNKLEELAGKLISSREEELRQLAREIHDDLTQRLAVLAIEAGKLELQLQDQGNVPVCEAIGQIKHNLIKVSEDVHSLSRQIHPSILDDLGLVRAIQSECGQFSVREGISVSFQEHDVPNTIDKDVSLCVYRVIQESLRNIAKHSQSKNVKISLEGTSGGIHLFVKDEGVGFVPQQVRYTPGIGLASLRERVQFVNGKFSITSRPGQGTVIEVFVPTTRVDT